MRLLDYLDKGASLGAAAPCLTMRGNTMDYGAVQRLSSRIGRALARSGLRPGDKVAILSGNGPVAFACVFGISRAGAVWCPVNPRNEAAENRDLLDLFGCRCLIFQAAFAPLVGKIVPQLPQLTTLVCLDGEGAAAFPLSVPFPLAVPFPPAVPFGQWLDGLGDVAGWRHGGGGGLQDPGQRRSGRPGPGAPAGPPHPLVAGVPARPCLTIVPA